MKKKPMTLMIIGLSVVFGGLIIFNVGKKLFLKNFFAHYHPPAVTVSSVTVNEQTWKPSIHAVGDFIAIHGVDINSEASGNVTAIHFNSGQMVDANTPLIDIEDGVDQAHLNFNLADLTLQDINYQRQLTLIKRGATSKADVDVAKAKYLEAKATVEQTEATIKQKHITTPFAGRLGIRLVNLGEFITPGKTSIVTLQSMDPLFLQFHVPEHQRPNIHLGQNILFSVEPQTHLVFSGKITAINAKIDPKTHNIQVQATVPNCPMSVLDQDASPSPLVQAQKIPNSNRVLITCNTEKNTAQKLQHYAFIPGMFASIDVEQPSIHKALVLPTTAISYSLYGNSVFLIQKDKNNPDDLWVKRTFVTTGDEQDNQVVITEGLKAGQLVVSAGEIKLQDNTRVVINNEVQLNLGHQP
ncbi:MAG: efflux RND transporter periplasmic adaptor subunit [Legionella sp.]|nr:efflux RND transporter periplasmic adaptor subunit [Legionella sp.]